VTLNHLYGPTCPFCATAVPEYAAVCAGCGAKKGNRAQTLRTGGALVRMAIWANTIGLVLFLMMYLFASPWIRPDVLNGTSPVCLIDLRIHSAPAMLPELRSWQHESYRLSAGDCSEVKDLPIIEKEFMKIFSAHQPKTVLAVEKKGLRTGAVVNAHPSWKGFMEAVIRSLLALLIGGAILRYLAHPLWNRFMGRLSDPMWVRK
jgi:hypothetical protein